MTVSTSSHYPPTAGVSLFRADQRGQTRIGWLNSRHSFSFGGYRDPDRNGFGPLRVLNDDRIQGGSGFGEHPHRDMEILTWILDGALEHRDSLGTQGVIRPGELQAMSAGTGIRHSEMNALADAETHLLQIWIRPDQTGHEPAYQQQAFDRAGRAGRWQLAASPDGADGSLSIHQRAWLHLAELAPGQTLPLGPTDHARIYLHVARGSVRVGDLVLHTGDALELTEPATRETRQITAEAQSELLRFDLAE